MTPKELAIKFHNWMRSNDTKENAEKYFHYTDSDMFDVFMEELNDKKDDMNPTPLTNLYIP